MNGSLNFNINNPFMLWFAEMLILIMIFNGFAQAGQDASTTCPANGQTLIWCTPASITASSDFTTTCPAAGASIFYTGKCFLYRSSK